MTKPTISYSDLDALKERLKDLETTKDIATEQLRNILNISFKKVSKRGAFRVLEALASYPKKPSTKLMDEYEVALLEQMMGIKEIQLYMMMIATELSKVDEVSENKEELQKE